MFKSYVSKITSFLIKNKEINKDDYKVYKYEFEALIECIVNIVILLIIGVLFNKLFYTIVFLLCYCPIRHFAGGYHANSSTKGSLILICIFILTIYTSSSINSQIYTLMIFLISTLNYVGIFILAPLEHRNNQLTLGEIKKYKKISRILAGIVYILILIFINIESLKELSAYMCGSLFWINIILCIGIVKSSFSKVY